VVYKPPFLVYYINIGKKPTVNKFKVTFEIETYSEDPTEWIVDAISTELEPEESLPFITVVRYEN